MAKVSFDFDEMMSRRAARQLAHRDVVIVFANDVGMTGKDDPEHLQYATVNGHVMVTFDRPFAGLTAKSTDHGGLICLSGGQDDIGRMVRTLTGFAQDHAPDDVKGRVFWL